MAKKYDKLTDVARELDVEKTKLRTAIKKYEVETGEKIIYQEESNKLFFVDVDKLSEFIPQLRKSDSIYYVQKRLGVLEQELIYINEALFSAGLRSRERSDKTFYNMLKETKEEEK